MKKEISEAAQAIAKEATKTAINKVSRKKLETAGTYVKKLKNDNFVEVNPDKQIQGTPSYS